MRGKLVAESSGTFALVFAGTWAILHLISAPNLKRQVVRVQT